MRFCKKNSKDSNLTLLIIIFFALIIFVGVHLYLQQKRYDSLMQRLCLAENSDIVRYYCYRNNCFPATLKNAWAFLIKSSKSKKEYKKNKEKMKKFFLDKNIVYIKKNKRAGIYLENNYTLVKIISKNKKGYLGRNYKKTDPIVKDLIK